MNDIRPWMIRWTLRSAIDIMLGVVALTISLIARKLGAPIADWWITTLEAVILVFGVTSLVPVAVFFLGRRTP